MKKLFYLLVMFSSVLWSCDKGNGEVDDPTNPDDPDNVKEVYLEVYPSELVFEAEREEKTFRINCYALDRRGNTVEYGWTLTGGDEWCRTDVTEGSGWNTYVTVTADSYMGFEDRNANLTIKAGDKSFVLTVTQKHGDAIVLSKDKFDVPVEGGEVTVQVKSNIQYDVYIPYQFRDWIEQSPASKAVTEKNFTFTISENEDYDKRDGYIVFKGNSLRDTVYIYQAQKNELVLSQSTYNLQSTGGEIVVELRTNIDYEVTILDNAASWISRAETKAIREDRLDFRIAANEGSEKRTARIAIKDKNSTLSDTVHVNQAPKGTYGGDLVWETEQDLIDFQAAGHTKVIGNIIVQGDEIRTLQKLNNVLTEIDGSITFDCHTLSSFDGLYELKKISGDLILQDGVMASCEGLQNLAEISGSFKVIASSSSLFSLTSFSGLSSLKKIGGDFELSATSSYSYSLRHLSSFEGLEDLVEIGGDFKVIASSDYSSSSLSSLTSFNGLSGLKKIGGDFELSATSSSYYSSSSSFKTSSSSLDNLSSFEGLENLAEIGGHFKVIASSYYSDYYDSSSSLSSLTSFSGLSGLKKIGGDFELRATSSSSSSSYNPSSSYSYSLDNLSSFEGLENLAEIGGHFKVIASSDYSSSSLSSLTSFSGLSGLKKIGGDFELSATSSFSSSLRLSSFEGLENLAEIGGHFKVIASSEQSSSLSSLTSFSGLSGLKKIGGDFELSATSSYSLDNLSSFEGLENLAEIGGHFKVIASYSSFSLTSFSGLSGLKKIGGDFELSATSSSSSSLNKLSSFEGLENLEEIMGKKLTITNCKALNNIDALSKVKALDEISITGCSELYDFCVLKNVVQNMSGTFYVNGNGYNPTKYQFLNGECSKTPGE